jgi:hypothetical protein
MQYNFTMREQDVSVRHCLSPDLQISPLAPGSVIINSSLQV